MYFHKKTFFGVRRLDVSFFVTTSDFVRKVHIRSTLYVSVRENKYAFGRCLADKTECADHSGLCDMKQTAKQVNICTKCIGEKSAQKRILCTSAFKHAR